LVGLPPSQDLAACVVVPVRNEVERMWSVLDALAHQQDLAGHALAGSRYEIILLLNNCTDGSTEVARAFKRAHPQLSLHLCVVDLPPEEAHVGRARRLLMDEACRRFRMLDRPLGLILTTDADTRVAEDWVVANLAEVAAGVDGVGGRVMICPIERARLDADVRRIFLLDLGYRQLCEALAALIDPEAHDPFPRHHQHCGASLAVTAAAYARVGRMPPVPSSEDVALFRAIRRIDGRFRHSPQVRVWTSARLVGRAARGYADSFSRFARQVEAGIELTVEPAATLERRFRARSRLRALWALRVHGGAKPLSGLAGELGVCSAWLASALGEHGPFGLLLEQIEARATFDPTVGGQRIEGAIGDLRRRIASLKRAIA
jgi:Glycosyl transferase family 2